MVKIQLYILLFLILFGGGRAFSQSLSLNHTQLNEYYRRQQLLGNVDPAISFAVRPLFSQALKKENIFDPEVLLDSLRHKDFDGGFTFSGEKGSIQLLPVSLLAQYNSHHPEGINDGSMIPAKGIQNRIDAGIYFKYGWFSIMLNPEIVYAHNPVFEGYPAGYTSSLGIKFPPAKSTIDLPERILDFDYTQVFLGQSSIRLTYKPVSLGISTENLWWGPGYKNSLLMTNSAQGFLHLTLNTVKPVRTPIGSFEGQLVGGKLEDSGYSTGAPDDWRYFNGIVLTYQPKWVPGLFLGMTRSFIIYHEDMGSGLGAYLPVFSLFSKSSGGSNSEVDSKRQDQRISAFVRWLFPESHGEIYFEYGREDHSWDTRDLILEPSHTAAYIFGARKLIALNNKSYFQIIGEISHFSADQTTINRRRDYELPAGDGWYHHIQVVHGYTHKGQLLGAGIDPNSNTQTLNVSWNSGLKQIGIEMERYLHNQNFWYDYVKDFRSNWVDLSAALFANWDYGHFLFYGKAKLVQSINYQWRYEPSWEKLIEDYWTHSKNTYNAHLQLGVTYRF